MASRKGLHALQEAIRLPQKVLDRTWAPPACLPGFNSWRTAC